MKWDCEGEWKPTSFEWRYLVLVTAGRHTSGPGTRGYQKRDLHHTPKGSKDGTPGRDKGVSVGCPAFFNLVIGRQCKQTFNGGTCLALTSFLDCQLASALKSNRYKRAGVGVGACQKLQSEWLQHGRELKLLVRLFSSASSDLVQSRICPSDVPVVGHVVPRAICLHLSSETQHYIHNRRFPLRRALKVSL